MDLAAAPLRVESALVVVKGRQFATSEPQSRAGRRTLHLPADAIAVLAEPARAQAARAACAAEHWQDHGHVFTTGVGTPVQPSRITARLHAITRKAGVPAPRFHDLRHVSATLQLRAGLPVEVVSRRLGQARISITIDVYRHLLADEARAAPSLADLLAGLGGRRGKAVREAR